MSQATTTTDHDEIRRWAEERGGRPSVVRTGRRKGGILRFDFGEKEEALEETSWDEFFQVFDESGLALLHQDQVASGETSRFFRFVNRDGAAEAKPRRAAARKAPAKSASAKAASDKAAKPAGKAAKPSAAKSGATKGGAAKASADKTGAAKAKAAKARSADKKPAAAAKGRAPAKPRAAAKDARQG